LKKVHRWI